VSSHAKSKRRRLIIGKKMENERRQRRRQGGLGCARLTILWGPIIPEERTERPRQCLIGELKEGERKGQSVLTHGSSAKTSTITWVIRGGQQALLIKEGGKGGKDPFMRSVEGYGAQMERGEKTFRGRRANGAVRKNKRGGEKRENQAVRGRILNMKGDLEVM